MKEEVMNDREKVMEVPAELAENPITPEDAIDPEAAVKEEEIQDPFKDIAYFVVFPHQLDIINQAIELVPEKMTVLRDTLIKAINSVLVPVSKEDLDKNKQE